MNKELTSKKSLPEDMGLAVGCAIGDFGEDCEAI